MSSRSLEDRLAKLKQLQKKKDEGSKLNRQELFKEHKKRSIGEHKLRSLQEKQEKALDELEQIETQEKGEDWDRKKAWDYSIEDYEKWDKKQAEKYSNSNNSGFQNYSQLAEQSYKKEISDLAIDREAYEKLKRKQEEKNQKLIKDSQSREASESNDDEPDYNNKPSKDAINQLVSGLKSSDLRRMKRRKDYSDTGSYINDKNKQFNDKLDRHYDKFI